MKLIIDRAIGFFGVSTHFTTSAGNDPTDSAADTAGTDETRFAPPAFASGSPASISVSDPNPRVFKISEDGTVLKQKDSTLIFGTLLGEFSADGSTNALLCNLAQDVSQQEDATINSDLRNLLHDFHDVGDLAAIDILRERDLGIATLNQTGGIRNHPTLTAEQKQVYGTVNQIETVLVNDPPAAPEHRPRRLCVLPLPSSQERCCTRRRSNMRLLIAAVALLVLAPFTASAQSLNLNGYHLTYDWEANSFEPTQLRANAPKGALTTTLEHGWRTFATGAANQEEQCYEDNSFGADPFSLPGNGTLQVEVSPAFSAYCPGPSGDVATKYVSGIVSTQGNFSQTYGYFEMRAKMPVGAGMWPAFWMAAASGAEFPEIDVTEQLGTAQFGSGGPIQTHWDVHSAKISGNSVGGWVKVPVNVQAGFHAYGALWTPKTINFFFDGKQIAQTPTPADANVPMYMEANVAVGGSWAGPPNNETAKMQIDYIRAFASGSGTPVSLQPISSPDGGGKTLYGARP